MATPPALPREESALMGGRPVTANSLSLYSEVSQVSVKAITQGFLSCANCLISGSLFGRLRQLA